jgi:type 2 lantibiotic biosynthesis protein LanM
VWSNCDLLFAESHLLAKHIQQSAHEVKDGSLLWLDPRPHPEQSGKRQTGPHLYGGSTGIALFLAAMERATEESGRYRDAALRAIAPLRQSLSHLVTNPARAGQIQFKLGGMIGLGGYIYGFVRIGKWLDEKELLDEARAIASLITPERISQDVDLDIAHGSAGALLALLLLDSVESGISDFPSPLELARLCGEHLLSHLVSIDGLPPAWPGKDGRFPLCGFSHGAAGISYALIRLFERTGEERFLAAARQGIEFERAHYDPEVRNWPDLRYPNQARYMTSWCHGAPGIALARLGMLRILDDDRIRSEIDDAVQTTRSLPQTPADFLCCGNTGRLETLLYANAQLGNPGFLDDAEAIASRVLARSLSRSGRYGWTETSEDPPPSLFTGIAGIGYTWLRMLDPSLPSILLLE